MRLIGLTGGIGTGKTTVSNYLAATHKLPIWDADIYSRLAVEPHSPVLNTLAVRYGSDLLYPDGSLNRGKLGDIIFNSLTERQWVESQIHPFVRDRFLEKRQELEKQSHLAEATAVLAIPLLFEANMTDLVTEIWVVYCSPSTQKQRLIQRHGSSLTPTQIQARIDSQMPLSEKCDRADVIIYNDGSLQHLYQQCDRALKGEGV
ncbi:dephospho-CoA kinase [Limnospira fusiformis]|uniref:dephospho-CoA kinase n=1 Tax=Limnospira fusiformis TaxID=54297 RepID=UPI0001E2A291